MLQPAYAFRFIESMYSLLSSCWYLLVVTHLLEYTALHLLHALARLLLEQFPSAPLPLQSLPFVVFLYHFVKGLSDAYATYRWHLAVLDAPRARRRDPRLNVFVRGLSSTVLLRVPPDANTAWIKRELERRWLIVNSQARSRLQYELVLSVGRGVPARALHDFQHLETAGVVNNSTIYVCPYILGGAPEYVEVGGSNLQRVEFQCPGPRCRETFKSLRGLRHHQTTSTSCRTSADNGDAGSIAMDVSQGLADLRPVDDRSIASAVLSGLQDASGNTQEPQTFNDAPGRFDGDFGMAMDVGDAPAAVGTGGMGTDADMVVDDPPPGKPPDAEQDDPLGWGEEDIRRAQRIGQRARGPEDDIFDEEEEAQEEEEELQVRIMDGDEQEVPIVGGAGGGGDERAERDGDAVQDVSDEQDGVDGGPATDPEQDAHAQQEKRRIVPFGGRAGEALNGDNPDPDGYEAYEARLPEANGDDNVYHPFASKMDWDIAAWAKNYGIGANALTALLKIEGLADGLGLQYRNNRQLNRLVDKALPSRSQFIRRSKKVGGEKVTLYMRDSLEVLRELYGRPDFANDLVFAPEKHFVLVKDVEERVWSDMHTGRWWWNMQKRVEEETPGATIIPLILSSDKTQLTQFRNRSAYPVYLTIGNLPKELRRKTSLQGQVLVGYLPTARLLHVTDDETRRRMLSNLFHDCMADILKPCKDVARAGVVLTSGDGVRRRCHPILAAFVGDYPEQVLVTGVKSGLCPKGTLDSSQFGDLEPCPPREHARAATALLRLKERLDWLRRLGRKGDIDPQLQACDRAGVKPIDSFWADYPYTDIFQAIVPDILHQMYQGVVKHLIAWLQHVYGAKELDERFKCLPDNHQLRAFSKGISGLSRVSGAEHQDICRVLLGVIIDLPLPPNDRKRVLKAVRALLDFVYVAQFPEATTSTIAQLEDALSRFHDNKQVFIDLEAQTHFNFPKMHALSHYVESLKLFGTADNFNTAYSERLHIDCAKEAWRATNHKDEYPQMTLWLQRREQILAHTTHIRWRQHDRPPAKDMPRAPLPGAPKLKQKLANNPSVESINIDKASQLYGANQLRRKLTEYIVRTKYPTIPERDIPQIADNFHIPFSTVSAYHRLKFWHPDIFEREGDLIPDLPDSLMARPAYLDTQKRRVQGTFNTALVDELGDGKLRVGQVRLIFSLPERARRVVFGHAAANVPTHLAYVEWFTKFRANPEPWHGLHYVKRSVTNNARVQNLRAATILPIERIERSVSLLPRFGRTVNPAWSADNVLELCNEFYVNSFSDKRAYITLK